MTLHPLLYEYLEILQKLDDNHQKERDRLRREYADRLLGASITPAQARYYDHESAKEQRLTERE